MAGRETDEAGLEPDATVPAEIDHAAEARAVHLDVFGMLHDGGDTIFLLGPHEPGFWAAFSDTNEARDGAADPIDRWSKRVIGDLAQRWGGVAVFPSDGPPYPPFQAWARASARAWDSPVGMLVHDTAGLWVSYRGAIRIPHLLDLPNTGTKPCLTCDAPCLTACPVDALGPNGYDVPACKSHLNTEDRADCMTQGCAVRRTCPVSQTYGRLPLQSAFHMRAFNPT
ncbi:ferredoxin [Aliiroseovarius sp. S253]|uniref:ferredoxin n=1 Tax=Aliiroseovarius sp. S253 TaxID=3415133 RepID=UPI003C7A70D4